MLVAVGAAPHPFPLRVGENGLSRRSPAVLRWLQGLAAAVARTSVVTSRGP